MKRSAIVIAIVIIIGLLFLSRFVFIVSEWEQVVLTQFGEPIGEPVTRAGLYFRLPWQVPHTFDKRLLEWDGEPNEVPTYDRKFIFVDTTARWRINDPLRFYQAVRDEQNAQSRLDDILDSEVRTAVSRHRLVDLVRTDNSIIDFYAGRESLYQEAIDQKGTSRQVEFLEPIEKGRDSIFQEVKDKSSPKLLDNFGIELVDIRVKRINYNQDVAKNVFQRMITERHKIADRYRSEGKGIQAKILGDMGKNLKRISSEAYRRAREIRGAGDAEATKIYAQAYSQDPEFFTFLKTLESFGETVNVNHRLILTTDSDYYRYLKEAGLTNR